VLLVLVPFLWRIPRHWLVPAALLVFAVTTLVAATVDQHGMRRGPDPRSYGDLTDVWTIVEQLAWSGGYPLAGWVGFALVGLWVSRLRLGDRGVQTGMLLGGGAVAALQLVAVWLFNDRHATHAASQGIGWIAFADTAAHSNRFAWYVIASGTAIAVIGGSLLLTRVIRALVHPVGVLGAMALSAYLAHLAIGFVLVWPWRDDERPALTAQLTVSATTVAALTVSALVWRRWFRRGPVETVLRSVAR
jgi:uncharacterized protein